MTTKVIALTVTLCVYSANAFSQVAGSQDAYQFFASGANEEIRMAEKRKKAVRIATCKEFESDAVGLGDDEHSASLDDLKPGQKCRLDRWIFSVVQVLPTKNSVLLRLGKNTVLVEGFSSPLLTDDKDAVIYAYVKVAEPYTYETITGGTNTVATLHLISADETRKRLKQDRDEHEKRIFDATFPEWESKAKTKVRAKFLRYAGGRVQLEKPDGTLLKVKLGDFATESADRIRKLIAQQKAAEKKESKRP